MMRSLVDLPDGVLGFAVEGKIHADDYRKVLIPAVEAAIAQRGEARLVIVFPEFSGLTGGAAWDDLTMGVEHRHEWRRIALVTDVPWMGHVVKLFGWMTPGEVRQFPMAEEAAAIAWAAA
jgi:hypothetical protein